MWTSDHTHIHTPQYNQGSPVKASERRWHPFSLSLTGSSVSFNAQTREARELFDLVLIMKCLCKRARAPVMLHSLKIPVQKAFCHVTLILAWWCEPSWFHQYLSYTAQHYNKETETSKQEWKEERGKWAAFYHCLLWEVKVSQWRSRLSWLTIVPRVQGQRVRKTGGGKEKNSAQFKQNLSCSVSNKDHILELFQFSCLRYIDGLCFSKSFWYVVLFEGTNLKDTKPDTLSEHQAQIYQPQHQLQKVKLYISSIA